MKHNFNRRDFLKLAGLLPLGLAAPRFMKNAVLSQTAGKQNVLIVVFDALSALNISFYGYGRETTPNLARLSERAVVYHNHYATGNFTTPGTASLLTGTLPWTHRAFQTSSGVADSVIPHNIFNAFQGYYRTAYTHNGFANIFLKQFRSQIEELVPPQNLFLKSYDEFLHTLFYNDDDIATVSWARNIDNEGGTSYSLFLSYLYKALQKKKVANFMAQFPLGIPSTNMASEINFVMEQAVEWIGSRVTAIPQPFIGYYHFLPPHTPYRTSLEFYRHFAKDGFQPLEKPMDIFADSDSNNYSTKERTEYDEFILYVDKAFGDLVASLEKSGILENTWVLFTADHGEMFERGLYGHGNPTLYQPVIRIPLLIFEPGRKTGADIYTPTSAIDVLPTLLHVTEQEIPQWVEGAILPPYAQAASNRNVYAIYAKKNGQYAPFTNASIALVKGRYKLIYCFGYPEIKQNEVLLFDIESDPDELVDLYSSKPEIAQELLAELKAKLAEVDKPYL